MNVTKRRQAERDLEECFVYIAEENIDAGVHFLVAAEESCEFLAKMPMIGSPRELRSKRLRNLRVWPVKGFEDYLIFYRPMDDGIEVLRVLHGRRDIEGIFSDE
jgi:toxin ParE1/3/4